MLFAKLKQPFLFCLWVSIRDHNTGGWVKIMGTVVIFTWLKYPFLELRAKQTNKKRWLLLINARLFIRYSPLIYPCRPCVEREIFLYMLVIHHLILSSLVTNTTFLTSVIQFHWISTSYHAAMCSRKVTLLPVQSLLPFCYQAKSYNMH